MDQRNQRDPNGPWEVPVLLHVEVKLDGRRYGPGKRIFVPFGMAVRMDRTGAATLLLPTMDMNTGQMHDPLAPPPDPRAGLTW